MKFVSKEDKELLLKDICQRLPYGVKVKTDNIHILRLGTHTRVGEYVTDVIEPCKPYLFPLSSMTEEQKREYNSLRNFVPTYHYEFGDIVEDTELYDNFESIDYLIANHFDFRGLIPMGLAIDATGLNIY